MVRIFKNSSLLQFGKNFANAPSYKNITCSEALIPAFSHSPFLFFSSKVVSPAVPGLLLRLKRRRFPATFGSQVAGLAMLNGDSFSHTPESLRNLYNMEYETMNCISNQGAGDFWNKSENDRVIQKSNNN